MLAYTVVSGYNEGRETRKTEEKVEEEMFLPLSTVYLLGVVRAEQGTTIAG